ncbi:hypothetical protein MUK42_21649 [Musa troglodytarum]|uniref:Uncharacterized protein n=1 Tax=Musa troglodytarum TaxID=320322 RepID=A0A9E7IIB3_9LILI|nr:hypothetical protein MUK42_21649 [Musa troglodytarum]
MVEAVEHQARIEDKCDRVQLQNEKDLYLQLLEDCTSVAQLKLEERQKGEGEESSSRIVLASKHMLQHIPIGSGAPRTISAC